MKRFSLSSLRRNLPGSVRLRGLVLFFSFCFLSRGPLNAQQTKADTEPFEDYEELWKHGDYQKALDTVEKMIDRADGRIPVRWAHARGQLHFALGRVDEAISDMEQVVNFVPEPVHVLELALYYQYRGRLDDFKMTLRMASSQNGRGYRYGRGQDNLVAMARVAELSGMSPKTILGNELNTLLESKPGFPPALILAGDIAYRRADYKLASDYYTQALAVEADNMDAMAGLAECYWKSDDERLEETLDKILKINPHYPRAKAIQAESLLDSGKPDEAMKIIEEALKINAVDTRFRSLKSAALFLQDDLPAMEQVQKAVLEFNPHCSEVYRVTGRIASRHYRFKEGSELQSRALEVDSEDNAARALYGFDLIRLGNETEGRQQLKMAFDADKYNVQVFNLLKVLDTLANFAVVKHDPFVLQVPKNEKDVLADDALAMLDEELKKYEEKYQVKLETPIYVQVFGSHDDFMVRSVGLPGSIGYMGICFGRLITMDSPSARGKWTMNWRSVLWHEFVHVITLQKTKNRMPRWLSEGISVYEETQRSPAWGQRLDPEYKSIVDQESLPGLSDLEKYFTQAKTPNHLMLGYFLSGEFVNFYVKTYGFDALRESLRLIGEGMKAEPALEKASKHSLEEVDASFKTYTKIRLLPLGNLPAVEKPDKKRFFNFANKDTSGTLDKEGWGKLQSPFTIAMEAGEKAVKEEKWDDAEREFKKAHEAFPDYMGADAPLRQLIKIYDKLGKRAELKVALRQEIDWNQSDFPACQRLIEILREEQNWPDLVHMADWSLGIDPFDISMRKAMLDGLLKTNDNDRALKLLAQLTELDKPHAPDYRLQRVDILIRESRWAEAKDETIAVLEDTPHFWSAQKRLLEIVEKGAASR